MDDEELRETERAARTGDGEALETLRRLTAERLCDPYLVGEILQHAKAEREEEVRLAEDRALRAQFSSWDRQFVAWCAALLVLSSLNGLRFMVQNALCLAAGVGAGLAYRAWVDARVRRVGRGS